MSKLSSRLNLSISASALDDASPVIERSLYGLFHIDLIGLIRNKVQLCKSFNIQPSEIDRMCFYEYEYYMDEVREIIKKEEEHNKEQEKKHGNLTTNRMYRDAQSQMAKMSKSSGAQMPKMPKAPKL